MSYGSSVRIDTKLVDALQREKLNQRASSVSEVIRYHRSKSRKFDKFNKVFSEWVKHHPNRTLEEFYTYAVANKVIRSI